MGAPHLFFLSHQNFQGNLSEANEMKERKIMRISSSSVSALYVGGKCCMSCSCITAKFAGYVNNSPRNLYTSFCPAISSNVAP